MAHGVCPVWLGYFHACPLRKWGQDPDKILGPHVKEGMTVMDVGCAMGFFSLPLARMVGPAGKVVCIDMQEKMFGRLSARARKAGVDDRIQPLLCQQNTLGVKELAGRVDFALAFAVVHEVPDKERLFGEIRDALAPGATLLMVEPKGHVTKTAFASSVDLAEKAGLILVERPAVARSRAALLRKT